MSQSSRPIPVKAVKCLFQIVDSSEVLNHEIGYDLDSISNRMVNILFFFYFYYFLGIKLST